MAFQKWTATWNQTFYTSATLTGNGDSGVIAVPDLGTAGVTVLPLGFNLTGANITTDETLALVVTWYTDAAGAFSPGATTFDTLNASTLTDWEAWPGDVTAYGTGRDLVPLFPYHKLAWTLAGTTKSMSFTLAINYMLFI